ncbi:MAG: excinuclease ABC subunit UvrB [Marinilabiliales bacterium]
MKFQLKSDFKPTGDQPEAIKQLTEGIISGQKYQTLLGVTGSGKTFTIANVIEKVQKPTLVISHNKTLAAQLYSEFKQFFPDNLVEFFVSYYDYYQPEAYIPVTDTYIEKDLLINDEIEKLRLSTTSALLSGRNDVIVVASVSCIYGIGNPDDFHENIVVVKQGEMISRNRFLRKLVDALYSRTETDISGGKFRVRGDTVDIFPAYNDLAYRVLFFGDEIEEISRFDPITGETKEYLNEITIYPANNFMTSKSRLQQAINDIQRDLVERIDFFKSNERLLEAKRIEERVTFDLEMIRELGHCSGIENYSRYFDGRKPGTRPFCLLDYFPKDFLTIIDESHVTIPQIRAMYAGDRSRKETLVEYGFRLPAALDNRPLKFQEFEALNNQMIFVSATPADYELEKCMGVVVDQVIRPTGLLDPEIIVKPTKNQIDDLIDEISLCINNNDRALVITLTKRMAEELTKYLSKLNIRCRFIHSDIDTLERVKIMDELRNGLFDVLIGVNLLREGLDLPEVALVAILDADKEGFLRNAKSLTQTAGRAARNINGKVIMYADKITKSMNETINETNRRRKKQMDYNKKHNITPQQIIKSSKKLIGFEKEKTNYYVEKEEINIAADPVSEYLSKEQILKLVETTRQKMEKAAKELNFIEAARYRDEMNQYLKMIDKHNKKI